MSDPKCVTHFTGCACNEKRMRELVTRVAELEGTMKPSLRCPKCNSSRKVPKCFKCGEATVPAPDGWEEPKLPPIERIRELAREVGYAVGVHGSLERDCDLIAAPWTDCAVGNYALMKHIADGIGAKILEISRKPLGRYAVTIQMDGYFKQIDLSVCPTLDAAKLQALEKVAEAARIASHEIQTQHVCWPEEVDDLADALEALDSEKGER